MLWKLIKILVHGCLLLGPLWELFLLWLVFQARRGYQVILQKYVNVELFFFFPKNFSSSEKKEICISKPLLIWWDLFSSAPHFRFLLCCPWMVIYLYHLYFHQDDLRPLTIEVKIKWSQTVHPIKSKIQVAYTFHKIVSVIYCFLSLQFSVLST